MVCYDGMALMTHRTTFALDKDTAKRLRSLAKRWKVSQAEVVRRAVETAEKQSSPEGSNPGSRLLELFANGQGLDADTAAGYIGEVYQDRQNWRPS